MSKLKISKLSYLLIIFIISIGGFTSCKKEIASVKSMPPKMSSLAATFNHSYYIATNGNDGNPGTLASPWKTINASVGKLVPGDILYVRGGTYHEVVNIDVSGTAAAPITISAYNGVPVIDGQGNLPVDDWSALININGSYAHVIGFEVKNSVLGHYARGITLYGPHNTVSSCNVHHVQSNGVLILGDYGIVEDSQVWESDQDNAANPGSGWSSGLTAARDPVNGITDNAIIRRNIVYNNWGEGLSTYEAQGTLIEDNIIYDNYAQNVYISDASNVLFQRNLAYTTPNNVVGVQRESSLADEVSTVPRSSNNTLINNLFLNMDLDAFSWTIVPGSGLTNALIANNTFVNSNLNTGTINSGNRIFNNIFTTSGNVPSTAGISWSNNLWQAARPANAAGSGDVFGDPLLALTGSTGPGQLTGDYFKLTASSPAIGRGIVLSEVTNDYFKTARGASPSIGAHEYPYSGATANLLLNPGFDNGITSWTGRSCSVSSTTTYHTAPKGIVTANRTNTSSGPSQDIKNILNSNGQGNYQIEGWMKMASGSDYGLVTLEITANGVTTYFEAGSPLTTSWTKVSNSVNVTWSGTVTSATFYLETINSTRNFYADDCVLKHL